LSSAIWNRRPVDPDFSQFGLRETVLDGQIQVARKLSRISIGYEDSVRDRSFVLDIVFILVRWL
jgi:hypothetical protein